MPITATTPLLNVAEINRSAAFYRLLGFDIVARTLSEQGGEAVWVMMQAETPDDQDHPVRLMLAAHGGVSHEERRMRPPFAGLVLYLECDDAPGLFQKLYDGGYKPEPVVELEDGGLQFFVRDPDGYEVALTSPGGPDHQQDDQTQ
ncbi:MAG: VOC family protein [Pseudomonadota bacterium]